MEDRSWMYDGGGGNAIVYFLKVSAFVESAKQHADRRHTRYIYCPCGTCKNLFMYDTPETIREHLLEKGFVKNYHIWTKHGEIETVAHGSVEGNIDIERVRMEGNTDRVRVEGNTEQVMAEGNNRDSATTGQNNDPCDEANESHRFDGGLDVEELLAHIHHEDLIEHRKRGLDNLDVLKKASNELLYEQSKGCHNDCTVLQLALDLLTLKAKNGWSDTSFNQLLELLAKILPKPNSVPTNTYHTKKLLSPLILGVEKIHACPNHCILYRNDHAKLTRCLVCNASRYKKNDDDDDSDDDDGFVGQKKDGKGRKRKKNILDNMRRPAQARAEARVRKVPALVMWYLPVIDRLKRLFANARDAKLMTWHNDNDGRKKDGMIRHPADARQWKNFDIKHRDFAKEERNLRMALSTDGMNPYGEMTNPHSTWPVIMSIYNIPSWLCHKRKYLLLTTLISGPKQTGIDIDVFLEPLMEDMKKLWEQGVKIYDAYRQESFTLYAIILCTVSDNPARSDLNGQVKGKAACSTCLDQTASVYLPFSTKLVFVKHRRWLSKKHKYRQMTDEFDGTIEKELAPKLRDGQFVFEMVKNIKYTYGKKGKKGKKTDKDVPFKKQSIFHRYLSYWKELEIGHATDPMHVGKGVFDNCSGTLLDISGKTKDGLRARRDLQRLNIKPELHPQERASGKFYLPPASWNLTVQEKTEFCKCLRGIKVPTGFCSNIKKLVSMNDLKISGYNTHECHMMLSLFLAVAIRVVKQPYIKLAIIRLCHFWNSISKKVISLVEIEMIRKEMIETMCQLEMCMPLSFFDLMEHYMIHLADQIAVLGPVYLHHMFPFERFMSIMKGHVRNRAHPEGSMIEAYTTEEVLEFYNDYNEDGKPIGLPLSRYEGRLLGKGITGKKTYNDEGYEMVSQAHSSLVQQLQIVEPYMQQHLQQLREQNKNCSEDWIIKEHKRNFTKWLKKLNLPIGETRDEKIMHLLADGPQQLVTTWQGYDINGFTFYTRQKDNKSQHQNSGISVTAQDSTLQENTYYGYIEEIWELTYGTSLQIPIFKCQWVKHPQGVEVDEYGFTLVSLNNLGHKDDPWILPERVAQVFYVLEPEHKKKHIVLSGKQRIVGVQNVTDAEEHNQFDEVSLFADMKKLKMVQTQLSYSPLPPYMRPDDGRNGKLVKG